MLDVAIWSEIYTLFEPLPDRKDSAKQLLLASPIEFSYMREEADTLTLEPPLSS